MLWEYCRRVRTGDTMTTPIASSPRKTADLDSPLLVLHRHRLAALPVLLHLGASGDPSSLGHGLAGFQHVVQSAGRRGSMSFFTQGLPLPRRVRCRWQCDPAEDKSRVTRSATDGLEPEGVSSERGQGGAERRPVLGFEDQLFSLEGVGAGDGGSGPPLAASAEGDGQHGK